jgi:SET domain-containing protein
MLILETREHGNVSTFIEPRALGNLVPVSICVSAEVANHRIALFAARDIFPNEELNYHPNCDFDWVRELNKVPDDPAKAGV